MQRPFESVETVLENAEGKSPLALAVVFLGLTAVGLVTVLGYVCIVAMQKL